jgi:hypothetical protein
VSVPTTLNAVDLMALARSSFFRKLFMSIPIKQTKIQDAGRATLQNSSVGVFRASKMAGMAS